MQRATCSKTSSKEHKEQSRRDSPPIPHEAKEARLKGNENFSKGKSKGIRAVGPQRQTARANFLDPSDEEYDNAGEVDLLATETAWIAACW